MYKTNALLLLRVLSSQHSTLTDILTSVLSPVLETAAMAEQRPYLPPEAARSSLEIVTTLAAIIVHGRGEEKKGRKCSQGFFKNGPKGGQNEESSVWGGESPVKVKNIVNFKSHQI